jgi:hypothetical protein
MVRRFGSRPGNQSRNAERPAIAGLSVKRMKRLELSTFCMATRPDLADWL